jgi:hypothetical protein
MAAGESKQGTATSGIRVKSASSTRMKEAMRLLRVRPLVARVCVCVERVPSFPLFVNLLVSRAVQLGNHKGQ